MNEISKYFDKKIIDHLSCFIVSYFEDIISETNIWTSFVEMHQKLYNKKLPFYNTGEYFEDEINVQDVRFLLWYFFNTAQTDRFINADHHFFLGMSLDIMKILEDEYEYAPENIVLKKYYEIDKNEPNFYVARNLIETILFKTYLFYTDTQAIQYDKEADLIEKYTDNKNLTSYLNDALDAGIHNARTSLLSLSGKEWASIIVGDTNPISTGLKQMSQKINGYFFYKGQDSIDIFIEHISSGIGFKVTKKSFDHYDSLTVHDDILFMGIVKWKDEWWFSGVFYKRQFDPELVLDEKNSIFGRRAVNFLDSEAKSINEILKMQFNAFKNFNNGSEIAFMPSDEIEGFIKDFTEYHNRSLKINKTHMITDGDPFLPVEHDESPNYKDISESGLVFYNLKSGIEIALKVNSAFPLPENEYYDADYSTEQLIRLLYSEEFSTELTKYCIDKCSVKLPFFALEEGKRMLEDIDFLLRFWKNSTYHSTPSIALTEVANS